MHVWKVYTYVQIHVHACLLDFHSVNVFDEIKEISSTCLCWNLMQRTENVAEG